MTSSAASTFGGELPRDGKTVAQRKTVRDRVGKPKPGGDRKIGAGRPAHRAKNFEDEAGAPFLIATPAIVAAIGERRVELREQIAVAGMKMHAVESGALCAFGGGGEIRNDVFDIALAHFHRRPRENGVGNDGRRQRDDFGNERLAAGVA